MLEQAKQLAEKVNELSNDDPGVQEDVADRLSRVDKPIQDIAAKLNKNRTDLHTNLLHSQDLKDSLEELNRWFDSANNLYRLLGPVSNRFNIIVDQEDRIEVRNRFYEFGILEKID